MYLSASNIYLISEAEIRQKIVSSRAELEDLQDTGENWKRWLKRYSQQGPKFA
jgi:hypothetical protein